MTTCQADVFALVRWFRQCDPVRRATVLRLVETAAWASQRQLDRRQGRRATEAAEPRRNIGKPVVTLMGDDREGA